MSTFQIASPAPRRRGGRARRIRGALAFYGFISPWLIGTLLLTAFPVGYAVYMSFTDWNGMTSFMPWVGLSNYQQVFTSGDTLSALSKTLILCAIVVPITIAGSLFLAVLLNKRMRGRTILRTLIYLPAVVPPVASALIWKVIFDKNSGAANRILAIFHVDPLDWLNGQLAFVVMIVVLLWGVGAGIIINLAALQTVPAEQLEAAKMDGANAFRSFRHVTLPAISPILLFQTVLVTITTLQTFVPAILLSPIAGSNVYTNIPPANDVYMVDVYEQYFDYSRYGMGSAMLVVFFAVILLMTGLIFKFLGRSVFYAVDPSESGKG
ncbi:sugar ABC transporter permease [Actinospica sp. MGRD01-02]|uniref:Sugar ABC transporter permease n=1 Tax=Actinospica acidithermotolerans TaxID=2828514 RepID=A0A941EAW1_9ACTN|nr:sugar ABC transporter permease [Actinospica acidithermotolerans]MBR7827213.1 sugar ABC transporter permease [Actinospica acidithermotolerans]